VDGIDTFRHLSKTCLLSRKRGSVRPSLLKHAWKDGEDRVPTDHACQAAAAEAARAIAPVRGLLAPVPDAAPEWPEDGEDVPIVIRQYLDPSGSLAARRAAERSAREAMSLSVTPVRAATGAVILLTFLDGLRADLVGSLVDWYADLLIRVPHALGSPAAAAPELKPPPEPGEWEAMGELKNSAQDLLTVLAGHRANHVSALIWRLALVEDTFAGGLRRLDVPVDASVLSAAEVAAATGSLFGITRSANG
jgi:hypothetical protein